MEKIIEMKNIKKLFPGVVALDDITFDLYPGEVHVLIGENGAGKSTLMKILSGVYTPTEGKMIIQGKEYSRLTPKESMEQGISVIFQELSVIDELSVSANCRAQKRSACCRWWITNIYTNGRRSCWTA